MIFVTRSKTRTEADCAPSSLQLAKIILPLTDLDIFDSIEMGYSIVDKGSTLNAPN